MAHTYAYAYADGVIHFGASVPPGALPIADGVESDLVRAITGSARLAYDNGTWLVPGIPEAADQKEGVDALIRYRKRVLQTLSRIDEDEGADG
jgi:hypothetical protein